MTSTDKPKAKEPTDWRKRFDTAEPPKTLLLHTDFAALSLTPVALFLRREVASAMPSLF
jgi:hypothetical protein